MSSPANAPGQSGRFLTGNALKLIAAASMLCDHAGLMLFPQFPILRIIGRLAYPIFAFMIAEGCKYTRNRAKYFGMVFGLGVVCQTAYYIFARDTYLSILITFSLSILTIYSLQNLKAKKNALSGLVFLSTVAGVWVLNRIFSIDYGFWGCMVPLFAAAFQNTKRDSLPVHITMLGIGLLLLSADLGGIQYCALLALPLLFCYNGKRGSWNLKYFFYIFYPLHLVLLEGLAMLVSFGK